MERRELKFHGRVQGVGFRYTAVQTSANFAVTGWVKNLPDLTVQMVVEGEPGEVDRFLAELERQILRGYGKVRESELVESGPATGDFVEFSVR